jgi:hypothetical protein
VVGCRVRKGGFCIIVGWMDCWTDGVGDAR